MADRVLVTGVSGFVGGHVALQLLNAGYRVRGSVRDANKGAGVRSALAAAGGDIARLEIVELDLLSDAGWDDAMADVRYVQHVASPFVTIMPDDKMELIRPAVDGTRRALEAALRAKVERVVLTSSLAAVMYGHDKNRTTPFTEADWTELEGADVNAYIEAKTRGEQTAWAIMEAAGRADDLAVVNPGPIIGPLLDDDPGTSVALVKRLLDGSIPAAARFYLLVVDVRDVAALEIAAMVTPEAGGKRFVVGSGPYSLLDAAKVLRAAIPARANKLPRFEVPDWLVRAFATFDKDTRGNIGELGIVKHIDAGAARALLGRAFIRDEDALIATAQSLIARGLV